MRGMGTGAEGRWHARALRGALVTWVGFASGCGDSSSPEPLTARDAAADVVMPDASASDASRSAPVVRRVCAAGDTDPLCCPVGWVPLVDGGCAPRSLACARPNAVAALACSAAVSPNDADARFWAWPSSPVGEAWFGRWRCPTGQIHTTDGSCGFAVLTACNLDEPQRPDNTCLPIGIARCEGGTWPEVPAELITARRVYVLQGAPSDAPGTEMAPLGDLARGLDLGGDGGVVVLGPGTYATSVVVRGRRTILGRCPQRVRILGPQPTAPEAILAAGPAIVVDGVGSVLSLRGVGVDSARMALAARNGGRIDAHRVVVRGLANVVTVDAGSTLVVEDSLVRGDLHAGYDGPAELISVFGGTLTLRGSRVEAGVDAMKSFESAGSVTIENSIVRGMGRGISVRGTSLRVRGLRMEDVRSPVLTISGGSAEIEDLSIATLRTRWVESAVVECDIGSRVAMRRLRIESGFGSALRVNQPDTEVTLEDAVIHSARQKGSSPGPCVQVGQLASFTGRRMRLSHCGGAGVVGVGLARVALEDVLVRDIVPDGEGYFGVGALMILGGSLSAHRVRIEGTSLAGVAALSLSDQVLRRLPWMTLWPPGQAFLEGPTRVNLRDVAVARAQPTDRYAAAGILASAGTRIEGERVSVEGQYGVGVAAVDDGLHRGLLSNILRTAFPGNMQTQNLIVTILGSNLDGPSAIDLAGVYLGPVSPWRTLYDLQNAGDQPSYVAAWGAYASPASSLRLRDARIEGGSSTDIGVVSGGASSVTRAVVRGVRACGTATLSSVTGASLEVRDVDVRDAVGACQESTLPRVRLPLSAD